MYYLLQVSEKTYPMVF